jgi:nitronate monooxygenase
MQRHTEREYTRVPEQETGTVTTENTGIDKTPGTTDRAPRWLDRRIIDLLAIDHPILQAPMAGAANPELAAAVSQAGGLGGYGAAGDAPVDLRAKVRQIRAHTDRPFNVNLFCARTEEFDRAARPGPRFTKLLEGYHREMGLGPLPDPRPLFGPAEEQLDVLLEEGVPVISLHFGVDTRSVSRAHAAGAKVLCSATTIEEAKILEAAGVDAIIAQGAEAGGHRGTFEGDAQRALVGTMALVPRVVDSVSVPVIAAGGVMDARGLVACLALGASAVQLGTAFLGCPEVPLAAAWRDALQVAEAESTIVTEAVSGRAARGIRNRYIEEVEALGEPLLPYPAQYSVSRGIRANATERGDGSFMVMWAGQGVGLFRRRTAAELVQQLVSDSQQLMDRLSAE